MKILNENLPKIANYTVILIGILSIFSFFRGCSYKKEQTKIKKELILLNDNMLNNYYTKDEFDTKLEIEGYEISKRMLYDNNAIIRTSIRPDDRMNEYDQKIKELENNLQK